MACLRLFFLGPFHAKIDECSITGFESDKVRALLAFLAVEASRPHRRSALAGLLWPETSEKAARACLRNALSNLRRVIKDHQAVPSFLLVEKETIQFNLESDFWLDVFEFEKKARLGIGSEIAAGISARLMPLKEAAGLYQGDFLKGFSLRDSPGFEEWQLLKQEYLLKQAVSTTAMLTDYYEQLGDYFQAGEYAERQLILDPWNENVHRSLMRLFARNGQRSLALAQFEVCRKCLSEGLDTQPEFETIQLYEQIRDGFYNRSEAAWDVRHNLPNQFAPIIGRFEELIEIDRQLADQSHRLLTLVGPGGIGKTRIAIEAARHQLNYHIDIGEVFFISFVPLRSVEAVTTAIIRELGLTYPQESNPREVLLEYLRGKKLLLILDSFEHVLDAVDLVLDILHIATGVKILITSRQRINIVDENILPVIGLDYPDEVKIDKENALDFDAVQLFVQGVKRLQPSYRFSDQDFKAATDICRFVQGIPLAILMAASWCTALTPSQIATELKKNSLDFLTTDWRDIPEHQRSFQAIFDYSFSLLNKVEQKVFEGLGIFQGGFTYPAALSILQADIAHLRRLVDKTMLQRSEAGRFVLHDLLRHFALQHLAGRPEMEHALQEKHMLFFTDALKDLASDLKGPHQADAMHDLLPDMSNTQAAWSWAVQHKRFDRLDLALDGLCGLYQWYGRYSDGVAACQLAENCLKIEMEAGLDEVEACLFIRILSWEVYFSGILGITSEGKRKLDLAFSSLSGLNPEHSIVRSTIAFLLQQAGLINIDKDPMMSWKYLLDSLALYRELGWRWHEAQVLEHLGQSVPLEHRFKSTRSWLEESLWIRNELGDQRGVASTLRSMSFIAAQEGDIERMGQLLEESLEINQVLGNPGIQAEILYSMAVRLVYMGKFAEASMILKESTEHYRENKALEKQLSILGIQGWIEINLGEYEQARMTYEAAKKMARQLNKKYAVAMIDLSLGQLQEAVGDDVNALQTLRESVLTYRQLPQIDELGMALCDLAVLEMRLGLPEQARQDMLEGIFITSQAKTWQAKLTALANYSHFIAEQGDVEKAVEIYTLAIRFPYLANSRFWWDKSGRCIQALAAGLDREVRAAAEQRGRLRELDEVFEEIQSTLLGKKPQIGCLTSGPGRGRRAGLQKTKRKKSEARRDKSDGC